MSSLTTKLRGTFRDDPAEPLFKDRFHWATCLHCKQRKYCREMWVWGAHLDVCEECFNEVMKENEP